MKRLTLILLCGSLLIGCKKTEDVEFNKFAAGTWQEHETGVAFAGTTYHISFDEDGTYKLIINYWTDMITGDPCTGPHNIYTYGTYSADNGILTLLGHYSDDMFTHIVPYCTKGTDYTESFHFVFSKGKIILNADYV